MEIEIGSKVQGTYFGVAFSGKVKEIWGWNDKWGRDGTDSVFVDLDFPIVVNGVERKGISWKPRANSKMQIVA